jgi:hypothetical protein
MSLALAIFEERFEENNQSLLEISAVTSFVGHLSSGSLLLGCELRAFASIMRFEYLKGHIGEKRFADSMLNHNSSFWRALLRRLYIEPSSLFLTPLWLKGGE